MEGKEKEAPNSQKEYQKEYREKHKGKWSKLLKCPDCGHEYSVSNTSHHFKSKKHEYGVIANENAKLRSIKNLVDSMNKK